EEMCEPIGTRVMDSTPPATTTSWYPDSTTATAKLSACCDEPHWRSIVTPLTVSGQPADSAAVRAMSPACSPPCVTQPQITSSTTDGSTPARSTSPFNTVADRSAGWTPARHPLRLPTALRTASTITAP